MGGKERKRNDQNGKIGNSSPLVNGNAIFKMAFKLLRVSFNTKNDMNATLPTYNVIYFHGISSGSLSSIKGMTIKKTLLTSEFPNQMDNSSMTLS